MLNTHYADKEFAQACNGDGKTDILIREEDKDVFIGELVKPAIICFVDCVNFTEARDRA